VFLTRPQADDGEKGGIPMPREALLARTLVELADNLVDNFDVVELLTLLADRCVEVLDVDAAGLMLAAPEGDLRVVASSSEGMRLVELFELQAEEGPCPDCYRTGEPTLNHNLATTDVPWPRFGPVALGAGFKSVHALPMRLRGVTIGALNLFRADEGALDEADVVAAQALADVATIAILQHRAAIQAHIVVDQLNHALNSRILIEQAKGVLAERAALSMQDAFTWLRDHARSHNLLLLDVAQSVIDGTLAPDAPRQPPSPPPLNEKRETRRRNQH
jgi:transcriptional regulator with GAF, ATPase, and Fis domain